MFVFMGLRTRMCITFGSSMKSEKDDRSISMMMDDIDIDSVRLDRYHYSTPARASGFGGGVCIVPIPPSQVPRS